MTYTETMSMRIFLVLLLLLPGWALAQETKKDQPSLAEIARKEKERRKKIDKKVPVIRNADLEKFQGRVTTGARPVAPPRDIVLPGIPEVPSTEAETKTEPGAAGVTEKDMEFWKSAFGEARLNLQNAVNRHLVLQLKMNNLRNAFFREDDGSTQALIQSQLQQTLEQIEAAKLELEQAKTAIERLQTEARRSGLSPRLIGDFTGELPETTGEIVPEAAVPPQ